MSKPKILAFSGSARKASYNQTLVQIAAQGAQQEGAEVDVINLADFSMPIYNHDVEQAEGLPPAARLLKQRFIASDGFLIASPEYNSAFSPLLKNAIDWISRREGEERYQLAFQNKVAVIMAASPGVSGGQRGLVFLRMLLTNMGVTVLPDSQVVAKADAAFHPDGYLRDQALQAQVLLSGKQIVHYLKAKPTGQTEEVTV